MRILNRGKGQGARGKGQGRCKSLSCPWPLAPRPYSITIPAPNEGRTKARASAEFAGTVYGQPAGDGAAVRRPNPAGGRAGAAGDRADPLAEQFGGHSRGGDFQRSGERA